LNEIVIESLRFLHSGLRWFFVGLVIFAALYYVARWVFRTDYDILSARLLSVLSVLMLLQGGIGALFALTLGSLTNVGAHLFWTSLATGWGVTPFLWRHRLMPHALRYRLLLGWLAVLVVLVLLGIAALPPDIQWRVYSNATS
jgi:hypothetical protein